MYRGKHAKSRTGNGKGHLLFICLTLLLATVAIVGTIAFIVTQTGPVQNQFTPSNVDCEVQTDNSIKNTGNIPAYIRAMVIVTWQDEAGNVLGQVPVAGTDYTVSIPANTKWVEMKEANQESIYYFSEAVAVGAFTEQLPSLKVVDGKAPEGYHLSVEIVAQAIQADGVGSDSKTPVEDAWGVTIKDGKVTAYVGGGAG